MGADENSEFPSELVFLECEGVILAFHKFTWPNVWQVHAIVSPKAWGNTKNPTKAIMELFWSEYEPSSVVALFEISNKLIQSLATHTGFVDAGQLSNNIKIMEYVKCQ